MKGIYFKLLFKYTSKWQLSLILLGSLTGFALVLFSLQLYSDYNELLSENTDLVRSQYTVINKKVGMLNTFSIGSTSFSEEEIENMKKQKFVEKAGIFKPNRFTTTATFSLGNSDPGNGVYLDLFFEAVDDEFIDVQPENWNWKEGNQDIPLILPTDFINMYNFNYAPGRGLPQLSKSTIGLITFDIQIRDVEGNKHLYIGHVVGFSDRIASVLVPGRFIDFANQQYAHTKTISPYRMIVKARNDQMGELSEYIENNGYETNTENMRSGKFNGMVYQSLKILAGMGILVILVSLVGFIQFSQLLVNKSSYEIETLSRLGFSYQVPLKFYMYFSIVVYIAIALLSFLIIYIAKYYLSSWMQNHGIDIYANISLNTILSALILIVVLLLMNYISLRKQLRSLEAR